MVGGPPGSGLSRHLCRFAIIRRDRASVSLVAVAVAGESRGISSSRKREVEEAEKIWPQ